ncbi:MAG TPA: hypothetical protein VGS07_10070 [Thermoanaerobaculia bacterium]|jgi:hypothetical protein|nr:hypothetical protein [Thermoanaerobaculia bacterium]
MNKNKVSKFSVFLLLALLLSPALALAEVVGNGTVVGVNWPGQGNVKDFAVANGDTVSGGHEAYTPKQATKWVKAGEKYNLIMVTQPKSHAQLFIVFSGTGHEHPYLERTLDRINAVVQGIGTGDKPAREGDTVKISTQAAEGGGVDVTLDVYRGQTAVSTFSFVQKK